MGLMYNYFMGWTPPTKYLKSPELLNEKRFYRLLSEQSNYIDHDLAMIFYTGLVMLVGNELRKNSFVRLPHLGDFALVRQKARPAWVGKSHIVINPIQILRFYPKAKLRRYFNERQGPIRYTEEMPAKFIQ